MKTIKTDVYTFDELDDKAKEKARDWYRQDNDMPFLWGHLMNLTKEALEEAGFKVGEMGQKFDVHYSLSHCQGDGLSFTGDLYRDGKHYRAVQHGSLYVHENTMSVYEITEYGNEIDASEVEEECREIAKKMRDAGYDAIDYENSAENIDQAMEANEYTFTKDGKRFG